MITVKHNFFGTSNMKKNGIFRVIVKLCLLWVVIIVSFFTIITPEFKHDYSASLIDKDNRAKSIDSPKIILVGNSNVCYGFRCDIIEEELGYEVVNMGLGTFINPETIERVGLLNVNKGDIIVDCPTAFDIGYGGFDPIGMWTIIENNFALWKYIPPRHWPEMIMAFPTYMSRCFQRYDNEATGNDDVFLGRKYFDKYGDNIYCDYYDNSVTLEDDEEAFVYAEATDDFVNRVNTLNKRVIERGGTLVVAGYPLIYKNTHPEREEYHRFNEKLSEKLDCQVISDYYDYLYPEELFYDSHLHLGTEGSRLRTMQLVNDLRNAGLVE